MSETVVETHQLTKRYGNFTALDSLSIRVARGQILGFIGPNGAGKTTTIKILVGLSRPTSGSATIAGVDCSKHGARIKQVVGYMPDRFGSYDNMRVHEYLDFFGAIFRIPTRKRRDRIEEVLNITNTASMKDKYVESLSHGMQQRVGIARTLLHDPEVLILDEPANGLDPKARIEMRELLLKLAASGKTLIVTSHILPELSRICNVVAIVTAGKLRAFGSQEEVMARLCPQRSYEVQLAPDEILAGARDKLASLLLNNEGISISEAERTLRFPTSRSESELADVLSQMVQAGMKVTQFREVTSDLEDAFLTVAASTD
ncbi:MAG: ABC transporter ATP-binding protein [Planctomycetes bacterium]|nr:ABC transporter ATP-binding protein [Planctomycetota bacterium]